MTASTPSRIGALTLSRISRDLRIRDAVRMKLRTEIAAALPTSNPRVLTIFRHEAEQGITEEPSLYVYGIDALHLALELHPPMTDFADAHGIERGAEDVALAMTVWTSGVPALDLIRPALIELGWIVAVVTDDGLIAYDGKGALRVSALDAMNPEVQA